MERGRQKVCWTCDNDMFERRLCTYGTHNSVKCVKHNNYSRARIRELILHFTLSIEGIGLDNDSSCPERAVEGDGVLGNIGQRNRHPVPFFHAQTLQCIGKAFR